MHWDAPDGKIVIGAPNDEQAASYHFRLMMGKNGVQNNLRSAQRLKDWSELPSKLGVFGQGGVTWNYSAPGVRSVLVEDDVTAAGFHRPVTLPQEALKSKAMADRVARREMAARSKNKETWMLTADGFSYWNGSALVPYGIDTVADVIASMAGGPTGAYFIHRVELKRDPSAGDTTSLAAVARGVWKL